MKSQTSKQQHHKRTRQIIIDAAITLISEKGAANLSLRDIARKTDYSPAGLYEYFSSKDEIIKAICAEGYLRLRTDLQTISVDMSLHNYLIQLALTYIQYARNHPEQFMFIFTNHTVENSEKMESLKIDPNNSLHIFYSAIERGINTNQIHKAPDQTVMDIAYGLWAMTHGTAMIQVKYLRSNEYSLASADQFAIETYVNAILKETHL